MAYSSKVDADFVHYLESMVNLNALDKITSDLGEELQDSQRVMNEIKGMIETLPKTGQDLKSGANFSGFRHEDISNFLNDSTPKLLMPDMVENNYDVDLDDVIATMKCYAEDIKKNLASVKPIIEVTTSTKELENLDLEQYASSLDVLCKRLGNLKLVKKEEGNMRNPDLEAKLAVLCDDVNMFTQMVQSKTTLSEANENWTPIQHQNESLNYDHIINKLLSGINEVSYLLHSKN